MAFWAYILRCADGSYYTGHTDNLEQRIGQHQTGVTGGYTHSRRPVALVWSQDFPSRIEALEAEFRIKPWSRAKKEALIAGDWSALSVAAMPPTERTARLSKVPQLRSGRTDVGNKSAQPTPFVPSAVDGLSPSILNAVKRPVVVLVRPQLGENIGKAARAMLNFGLAELRLVTPRDGWPNPSAGPAASGADIVIENAAVFATVAEAVVDCTHVYATTVRKREVTKPVVTPEQAATAIHAEPGRAAILFGPERSGLETDDVALARTIITVPINPDFSSLNLAQAVILVAYEWSKGVALASPPATDLDPPAPQEEFEGMYAQLEGMLEQTRFFHIADRKHVVQRTLRTLLTKPGWTHQELRTFRGVLSALAGKRARP